MGEATPIWVSGFGKGDLRLLGFFKSPFNNKTVASLSVSDPQDPLQALLKSVKKLVCCHPTHTKTVILVGKECYPTHHNTISVFIPFTVL